MITPFKTLLYEAVVVFRVTGCVCYFSLTSFYAQKSGMNIIQINNVVPLLTECLQSPKVSATTVTSGRALQ